MSRSPLSGELLSGLQRVAGNQAVRRLVEGRRPPAAQDTAADGVAEDGVPVQAMETIDLSPKGWHARLDAWLGGLPRMTMRVAGRNLPAFKATTILALGAALGAGLLTAPLVGVRPAFWVLAWFATTLLLVAVLFVHRLVNYAFQTVASLGFLVAGIVLPGSALAMLDVGAVALAGATAVGRVGCALAGCCHGRPARMGLRYGVEHVRGTFPARMAGVPLLPVQLIESGACAILAVGVAAVAALAPPGGAFVTWALAYGALRWVSEGLRGDRRPRFMGVSQARWTSAALGVGALALIAGGVLPGGAPVVLLAGALPLFAGAEAVAWRLGRRVPTMLGDFTTWDGLASALHALTLDPAQDAPRTPATVTTPAGVRLSLTRAAGRRGTVTTWGLSVDGGAGVERIRATARSILCLRHPGRTGVLVHGVRGVSCLIVGDVGLAEPPHYRIPELRRS